MTTTHVVGAGLAGLAAAVSLARSGARVCLYEAAPRAGGRCRSYFEPALERTVDNGSHVILGANDATLAYVDAIGGRDALLEVAPATIPFLDLATGESWALRPNAGPLPWWIFASTRRATGTRAADYLALIPLLAARRDATVTELAAPGSAIFTRFVEPLATAIMNTPPDVAAARPLARVLRQTLLRGERACRPIMARNGLSDALVDPALALLARHGAVCRMNARVDRLDVADGEVVALTVAGERMAVESGDGVILATPPWASAGLVPGLQVPEQHCAIVNAHFRVAAPPHLANGVPLLALVNATAQWLIVRGDVVSVTVSAADALVDSDSEATLRQLWHETAKALRLSGPMPPARLIKEKRATIRQTPAAERLRPQPGTALRNLFLAGDWTATGLPATIEGAIRSGQAAAALARGRVARSAVAG
jgi:squalene-associated FAD-dependent desaturase